MNPCCTTTLYAWFKAEGLHVLGERHSGPFCVGRLDEIIHNAWYHDGDSIPTGRTLEIPR